MKIGDSIYHPCSMDIIQHKIISIRQFEGFNHYVLKSVHNVGACGRIEVIVSENKGKLRFIELIDEENIEYASGLQDFIEGNYYFSENEAKKEFYKKQKTVCWANMENKKRLYEQAKAHYERVEKLIKMIENYDK